MNKKNVKTKTITQQEVWDQGEHVCDWPCDVGGSNASREHIIKFKGDDVAVITDWDNNLRWPNQPVGYAETDID